jgi:hypothetical protein
VVLALEEFREHAGSYPPDAPALELALVSDAEARATVQKGRFCYEDLGHEYLLRDEWRGRDWGIRDDVRSEAAVLVPVTGNPVPGTTP